MNKTPGDVSGNMDATLTYGQEVSLSELLLVLWRYWLLVLGIAVSVGILAFLVSSNRTPVYEASSRLLVSPPTIAGGDRPPVSLGTYQALISNQSLILEVLKELGLTEPPHELTPAEALQRNLSIVAVGTEVIMITARLDDAALAAQLANRLAERSIRVGQQVVQEDVDMIKVQVDESHKRLEEAEGRLLAYRKQAQLEALHAEVDVLLEERSKQLPLLVQIEGERARIRQTIEELARHDPGPRQDRVADPSVTRESTGASESPWLTRSEKERAPAERTVYEVLSQQLADSRTKLSELESQRAEILRATDLTNLGAKKLNELYTSEVELERLQREAELAREAYFNVAIPYGEARIQAAGLGPQLQVIDVAVPPNRPVSPRPLRDTTVALLVATVLAGAAVLLYGVMSDRRSVGAR
jgi:uncharacterized protein involved in exopolysaccharide biosynthesis